MFSLLRMHNEFFLFFLFFFLVFNAPSQFKWWPIIDAAAYFAAATLNCYFLLSLQLGRASTLLQLQWFLPRGCKKRALIAVVKRPQLFSCFLVHSLFCRRLLWNFSFEDQCSMQKNFVSLLERRFWMHFFSEYGVQCIDLKIKILKYYMDIVAWIWII